MAADPKRLAPTKETLARLFAFSGNECAFPGCNHRLINDVGEFIAQVCHIRAASVGGERFDATQTNEERRAYENLVLLCYEHHTLTNDVERFPVDAMAKLKREHELRFSKGMEMMLATVGDITEQIPSTPPKTGARFHQWRTANKKHAGEREELLEGLTLLHQRLVQRPPAERSLLRVILSRGVAKNLDAKLKVPLTEVYEVSTEDANRTRDLVRLLDGQHFVDVEKDDYFGQDTVEVRFDENGWNVMAEIKAFCVWAQEDLKRVIEALDFSAFD